MSTESVNESAEEPTTNNPVDETVAQAAAPSVPVEPLTPEQIAELQARAAKADEHWDRLLRLTADMDNYRKRAARDRDDAVRNAQERILSKLLPVVDNFEMAMQVASTSEGASLDSLKSGVQMILSQMKGVLSESGVEEIDATGQPFDPNLHEAVSQAESADVAEGSVLQQLRKGYKMRDRLMRAATVVVAKKPAEPSA
jgi:molecular chaperone GrpE